MYVVLFAVTMVSVAPCFPVRHVVVCGRCHRPVPTAVFVVCRRVPLLGAFAKLRKLTTVMRLLNKNYIHTSEGQSNENFKIAIKIQNTA